MPLGVAWSVSRWARSAIGISDERVSVNVSDSRFNTNLNRIRRELAYFITNSHFTLRLQGLSIGGTGPSNGGFGPLNLTARGLDPKAN